MHKNILVLTLLVFLGSSFYSVKGFKVGKKAPMSNVKMKDVSGNSFSIEDVKGDKGTIVIFSCNTCPFVKGSDSFDGWEKQYNDLYGFAKKSGFGMVLINSNEAKRNGDDSFDKMAQRAKDQKYKMKYLVDENSTLANAYGAKTTPHVFLLDSDMKLVYTGPIDNSHMPKEDKKSYLRDAISYQLKKQKITASTIAPVGCSIKRIK